MTAARASTARAAARRRNGARSKGPRSAAGKARSARNALKHGLSARRMLLLPDEDAADFGAFARALQGELRPEGALQTDLAPRVAVAAWRARRADRLEAALLGRHLEIDADPQLALGAGLIRDGHGPRALETRWPEPAPTTAVGALGPTATGARCWPSCSARWPC